MPPRVRAPTRNTRATAAPQAKTQQAQVKAPAPSKKRARDPADGGNDEDTHNGRRSVKRRGKKELSDGGKCASIFIRSSSYLPKLVQNDTSGTTVIPLPPQLTDTASAAAAETPGTAKRLKFNPEVHGAELQDRFLQLQEDLFEKLVSPRKGTSSAGEIAQNLELAVRRPPRSKNNPKPKPKPIKKALLPSTTKPASRPAPTVLLSLSERLRRLGSPATIANTSIKPTNILPVRARPVAAAPAPAVKSTKPLTKPTFELPGDAHMKKRAVEREERRKRMEEAAVEREAAKRAGKPGVGAKREVGQKEGHVEKPRASPPTITPQASSSTSTASAPTSAAPVPVTTTTTTSSAVSGLSPVKLATSLIPSFVTRGFTAVTGAVRMSVPSSPARKQAPEPEPEPELPETTPAPAPGPEPRHEEEEEEEAPEPEPEPQPQPQPQTPNDKDLAAQEGRRREVEEEEVRRLRAEAAERGKESAMMWAEQMRMKALGAASSPAKPSPS